MAKRRNQPTKRQSQSRAFSEMMAAIDRLYRAPNVYVADVDAIFASVWATWKVLKVSVKIESE